MILGIVLVIGLVIVVANFAIDLVVAWMDPRAAEAGARRLCRRPRAPEPAREQRLSSRRADPARLPDVPWSGRTGARLVRRHAGAGARGTRPRAGAGRRRPPGRPGPARAGSPSTCFGGALLPPGCRLRALPRPGGPPRRARRAAPRSSSPRTGRTSRTRAAAVPFARRRSSPSGGRTRSWRSRHGCSTPGRGRARGAREELRDRLRRRPRRVRAARRRGRPGRGRLVAERDRLPLRGSLSERKNVLRLARAFELRGEGELRSSATARCVARSRAGPGSTSPATSITTRVPRGWPRRTSSASRASRSRSASHARGHGSGRSVVATSVGGPPEFVPDGRGHPRRSDRRRRGALGRSMRRRSYRAPTWRPGSAAEAHDVRRQAERVEELLARAAAARGRRA